MSIQYPAGRYRLKTIGAALGESKKTGTPQVEINVEVQGYYDPEGGFRECGGDRTIFMALTEGTLGTPADPGWVYLALLDLGWAGKSFTELSALAGHVRDGECKHDEHEGKASEKWSLYRRRVAEPQRPAQAQTVRSLNAKFAGLLKAASLQATTHKDVDDVIEEATNAPQTKRRQTARQPAAAEMESPPDGGVF